MEQVEQCIESLRNLSYDIVTSCAKNSLDDALREDTPNSTTMFCTQANGASDDISKIADFLVGFVAYGDVEIVVHNTHMTLSRYKLKKGQFVYAIDYDYIMPLLSTRFECIRLWVISGLPNDVGIVYGLLCNREVRRFISCNMTKCGTVYFGSGMCYKECNKDCAIYTMPNMRCIPTPQECMAMSKERTMTLLQEFAEVTWNPQRVRMWCLPFDDDFALSTERSYKNEVRKIWLDNILVIDGFDVKYQTTPGALHCNIDKLLRMQNMSICGQVRFVTYSSDEGMHVHKDYSLEGGTHTFVAYLDDNTAGHICFPHLCIRVIPRRNRVIIFDVDLIHCVEPCCEPKRIITGECMFSWEK